MNRAKGSKLSVSKDQIDDINSFLDSELASAKNSEAGNSANISFDFEKSIDRRYSREEMREQSQERSLNPSKSLNNLSSKIKRIEEQMKEVHREEKLQAFGFLQNIASHDMKNEDRLLQASFTPALLDKTKEKIQARDIDYRNEIHISPD